MTMRILHLLLSSRFSLSENCTAHRITRGAVMGVQGACPLARGPNYNVIRRSESSNYLMRLMLPPVSLALGVIR